MTMIVILKMDLLWIQTKCRKFDNWEENLIQGMYYMYLYWVQNAK